MDWLTKPFEPNLKFALELKEDLKTKYFNQHEKAKQTLEKFSYSLQKIFLEHQKLLAENIELSITNENLKQIIDKQKPLQQQVLTVTDTKPSQILGASPNFNRKLLFKQSPDNNKIDDKISDEQLIKEKENINEFVQIFTCDFESDIEDENVKKCHSSPPSVGISQVKVQSSPVLCKRKRSNIKKSNSSFSNTSSHSIASSDDSKIDSINNTATIDKNINEIDIVYDKEPVHEVFNEPLKTIENTFLSSTINSQDKNKDCKVLVVSKTNYGKTEFIENGKKLRQSKLILQKVTPIIDISKVESNDNVSSRSDSKLKVNSLQNETFFNSKHNIEKVTFNKQSDRVNKDCNDSSNSRKSHKLNTDSSNSHNRTSTKTHNTSSTDDELIEKSPANNDKSKLRTKLSFHKKPDSNKIKGKTGVINTDKVLKVKRIPLGHSTQLKDEFKSVVKSPKTSNSQKETNSHSTQFEDEFKNVNSPNPSIYEQNPVKSNLNKEDEQKLLESEKRFCDETYFSPAEMGTSNSEVKRRVKSTNVKNSDKILNVKEEPNSHSTQFEDEFKNVNSPNPSIFVRKQAKLCFNNKAEKQKLSEPQRTYCDETYFSPAEMTTNKTNVGDYDIDVAEFEEEMKCKAPPAKKMLLNSFDIIPGRQEKSPDYAYKEAPVRKQNERAQLEGWCCRDCEKWYGHLPEKERKKRQNQCSRHRGKYKPIASTPESFWNPGFDDTNESSTCGDS